MKTIKELEDYHKITCGHWNNLGIQGRENYVDDTCTCGLTMIIKELELKLKHYETI